MIGKICTSITPFYNSSKKAQEFKSRPILIIGLADASDYNVLPISRVTNSYNLDAVYDIPIDPAQYPLLLLTSQSYIRTHKQTIINHGSIGKTISDLKAVYEELYLDILSKLEQYNKSLIDSAL